LIVEYQNIDAWVDELKLMDNGSQAAKVYCKRVHKAKAFKDKPQDGIMAECVIVACSRKKHPCSFTQISNFTGVRGEGDRLDVQVS
jgi:transcription initiation factor TFIIIB Brf1 subunit/transcription initiation factor TFIIB